MLPTSEDKDTRYFIDLDLKNRKIIGWGCDQRHGLEQDLAEPTHHRVFITKGQFHKLEARSKLPGKR
jgi:hypothetical protein